MDAIEPDLAAEQNNAQIFTTVTLGNSSPNKVHQQPKIIKKISNFLETHPLSIIWVKLNQSVTIIALSIAIFSFYFAFKKYNADLAKNEEDRIAKAWDVVARARGRRSNIGQIAALERLNALHQSLDHVDLHGTVMMRIRLGGANLENANFAGATLISSNFNDANLCGADLSKANLAGVSMVNAQLDDADFSTASLAFARVDLSLLLAWSLKNTDLSGVTLVFDDTEDGEKWDSFSDTLAESRDYDDIQNMLNEACADPKFPIKVDRQLPFTFPSRPCPRPLNYGELIARYKLASSPTVANPFK